MTTWLLSLLVPVCLVVAWRLLQRPLRYQIEERTVERAREQFRVQRERLEARFVTELGRIDPIEKLRWEEGNWRDEIVWARDRRSRRLLAMVCVTFESEGFHDFPDLPARHATAIFEYCKGRWLAEGKRLDEIRPDEAFLGNQGYEPVVLPQRRG